MDRNELSEVVDDLLTIAKVAMPAELFSIDPRIVRAQALLVKIRTQKTSGVLRVPTVPRAKPDHLDEIIAIIEGEGEGVSDDRYEGPHQSNRAMQLDIRPPESD